MREVEILKKKQLKCYLYTRVSTSMQVDGYSLDAQRDKLRKYAAYEDMIVAGEYSDEGFSGKNIQGRQEFQRMLNDIQDGKDDVSYVLVFKLSRFGRNAADVLNSLQLMQDFGVNLICVEDGIDSSKDAGKLMISVLSAVAEIERENIRTQTMAGREQKAREGKWNGGFAPYGYKLENGNLVIAEDEVEVIRVIYDRYIHTNEGVAGVAKYLNRNGYTKKLRQNNTIPGFSRDFVKNVLYNPVYMGKIAYGRRRTEKKQGTRNEMHVVEQSEFPVYEGQHEAIISEEDWYLAQEKRKINSFKREKVNNPDHAHILSGILKCPCCGKSMYGNIAKAHSKDKKTRYYYYCKNTVTPTGHECSFRLNIEQTEINKFVAKVISAMVNNPRFVEAIQAKIGTAVDTEDMERQIAVLQGRLKQAFGTKSRLERQMDTLDINDAHYDRKILDLQRRYDEQYDTIEEIEVQIGELQSQIRSIQQEKISGDNIYRLLLAFDEVYHSATEAEQKEFMKAFIERIEMFPEKRKDGSWIKKIVFNFPVPVDGEEVKELPLETETTVETVTVGGNKYYPKSDGNMTTGDLPEFTSPEEDVSRVVESNEYMTLTVDVTGTPAPALQWQVSRDGGETWENIEGATEATYQAILPLSLHGAKFRCAATNKDGTTYSHTFTSYYCPAYLRGAASPMRGNGEFIQGEIATITAGFYDGQTWYPISSLTGVTAEYRWKYCRNVMPTEEEWAAIPHAGESYPITITDEMNYQSVCFHVTLTYPDNTVKTVTGYWRLNVCVTPVVTEQPQSVSAAAGDSVTFSAKLIDQYLNTLEYQWQSSTDGGQSWTDIEGAGGKSTADFWNYTPSYTIPSVTAAQSGQLFRCVLWNTNNHTGSDRVSTPPVYSEPATLTVTPPTHEHRYGDWSKDGTNHWHECTDAACPNQSGSIKDKAAHVYTDDADTTCNICGYERTVTPEIIPVSQITLNKTETSISVGNSETLTATVAPENATNKALTWASSDEDVATVALDGTVTAVKVGTATITATAADGSGKSATCTVTVIGGTTPSQPGGSTGGSSGGSSSGGGGGSSSTTPTKPETATKPDGTKVETVTKPDGTKVETTTGKDGSVTKTETKKDGSSVTENKAADGSIGTVKTDKNGQTEAAAKVSGKAVEDAKKNGEAVKVPVEVEATRNSSTAPTVSIELPKGAGETKVEIPVSNVTPGTVAVLVHPDGTEEILKDSIPTEDGIQLTVDGSATVKIVDNSKGFIDTRNHWAEDEIDFVSARGLVNGMSTTIYAPNASTTRAQLWTILARQNGADLTGGNTWYEKAQNWTKDKGVSDGANPNAAINRAQMVTMLWRAVGQPTAGGTANFTDVPTDSYYAQAVAWAVENGITTGVGNGHFDPTGTCTRAQIAAFLARSMK